MLSDTLIGCTVELVGPLAAEFPGRAVVVRAATLRGREAVLVDFAGGPAGCAFPADCVRVLDRLPEGSDAR